MSRTTEPDLATSHDPAEEPAPPTAVRDAARRRELAVATATMAAWFAGVLVLWWRYAPNGYNTSDYGFIIGQSYRVLHGEIPHVDFISARPAGSAFLHVVDFLLPMPLVESSRLVALTLSVGVALLSGVAVLGRQPWRWTWIGHLVVATATLFTVNTFQIGPWYTIDGLIFVVGSLAALRLWDERGNLGLPVVGLLAAGAAPLFKQSFFLAPVLAAGWVVLRLHERRLLGWRRLVTAAVLIGLPGLAYLVLMALAGGLSPMVSQLTSATEPDWIGVMGTSSVVAPPFRQAVVAGAVVAVVVVIWFSGDRRLGGASPVRAGAWAGLGAAAFLLTAYVGLAAHLSMYDMTWSTRLFWISGTATLVAGATRRRLRLAEVGIVAAAWMTVLSWGMQWPLLTAGGTLLVVTQVLAEPTGDVLRSTRGRVHHVAPWAVASVVALVATALVMDDSIENRVVHRDLPASQLTVALRPIDSDFGRVRTNPSTATFVGDAAECVDEHPADGVVFGSWNSDLYALLGLRNPLATDASNGYEITGAEEQYRDSVRHLAARGDFLVLFPLLNPETVHTVPVAQLPVARTSTPIPEYWFTGSVPYCWMAGLLVGEKVACGTWVGLWEPDRR